MGKKKKAIWRRVSRGLWTIIVCLLLTLAASANGFDRIGSVLATDIRTYINGYEIPAYNVDGKMAVVCSDLKTYGFQTVYDNESRTTRISLNPQKSGIVPVTQENTVRKGIGQKVMDVYDTDIVVMLDNRIVTSYNVDNKMAIPFSELKNFGEYTYDNTTRSANLVLDGFPRKRLASEEGFLIEEISDELFERMYGKSYKSYCTVPREDLRHLWVRYVDFEGKEQKGELVCHYCIANDLIEIFRELLEAEYPIGTIDLVDHYNADDETSMRANNTSCFNYRYVIRTNVVSKHGYGMAVDVNPLYNPCVKVRDGVVYLEPGTASDYVDRTKDFPHKIDENDLCYRLFTEHGFIWGGDWYHSWDYQHFELPDESVPNWYNT